MTTKLKHDKKQMDEKMKKSVHNQHTSRGLAYKQAQTISSIDTSTIPSNETTKQLFSIYGSDIIKNLKEEELRPEFIVTDNLL